MPFEAKVYKILVASPGDVDEERQAIPDVISRWNDINAEESKVVLLPVKWETHSAPIMGDRAQSVINKQMIHACDMAIGVFWTRLGSPTGVSESGTAEEIEWFIENRRPVMIYFSSRAIEPSKLDIDQYKSLKNFESKMQKIGLIGSYSSIVDFKEKLLHQITINLKSLIEKGGVDVPKKEDQIDSINAIKKIIKDGKIYMEDYEKDGEVRSFLVKGDTKPIKEELKRLGGKWNPALRGVGVRKGERA